MHFIQNYKQDLCVLQFGMVFHAGDLHLQELQRHLAVHPLKGRMLQVSYTLSFLKIKNLGDPETIENVGGFYLNSFQLDKTHCSA